MAEMPFTSHNNDHNPPSFGLPTAAPVLEYICLFTHDLKRKQKRWQDGRLKFHTFNKRIMVYDEKGNFIGDMHWREDMDFGEGEELNLERGAVIVQVAECVGSKDQDLTALLDKRAREVEQRHARSSTAAADSPLPTMRLSAVSQNHPQAQFRQRHLADVFNTPRGPQGRASIPTTSPYDERIAAQQTSSPLDENQRPAKRRKRDRSPPSKSGYAQNLFGATLNLSSWTASAPVRSQPANTSRNSSPPLETIPNLLVPYRNGRPSRPRTSTIVDLTDDGPVSTGNSKTSPAVDREDSTSDATEAPVKRPCLVPKPFKSPGVGFPRSYPTQKEIQPNPETRNLSQLCGQQPEEYAESSGNIAANRGIRALRNNKRTPAVHQPGTQPSNSMLHMSAPCLLEGPSEAVGGDVENAALKPATEEPLRRLAVDAGPEEPKTKLRIKARQKRGLLVIAKRATTKILTTQANPLETRTEAPSEGKRHITRGASPDCSQSARPVSPVGMLPHSIDGNVKRDTSERLPVGVRNHKEFETRSNPIVETLTQSEPEPADNEDDQSSDEPMPSRVPKLWMRRRQSSPGPHREVETMTTQSGPRLASLGRRSVKSKEIIGSLTKRTSRSSAKSCAATATSAQKGLTGPRRSNSEDRSAKKVNNAREVEAEPEAAARLANPATRGRKAAQKSDAAGSVPEPVLPAITDLTVTRHDGRRAKKPEAKLNLESTQAKRETSNKLSGFSRANGGPWSKESFDLLGCTRPG